MLGLIGLGAIAAVGVGPSIQVSPEAPMTESARRSIFELWLELLRSNLYQVLSVRADRLG